MQKFRITLTGTRPLLMHSARLADPLDPATKAVAKVSKKRQKTEEDYLELARLEHSGSMYHDPDIGPYVPSDNIARVLTDAGARFKKGKALKSAMLLTTDRNPLVYKGPRDVDGLFADANFVHRCTVKVGMSRTTRCRPFFKDWSTDCEGILDDREVDFDQFVTISQIAGELLGIGDWRPKYGRFTAEVERV